MNKFRLSFHSPVFYLYIFWLLIVTLNCETIDDKELQNRKHIQEQDKLSSRARFLVECNGCKPTVEELLFYNQIKNKEVLSNHPNLYPSEEVNIDRIRQNMTSKNGNNPFFMYEFLNPWKAQTSNSPRPRVYRPWGQSNPNGYRQNAPVNVKPGHQF